MLVGVPFALSNVTTSSILALADKGWRRALDENPHLRDGLNVHHGRITYRAVANALKLPYTHADHALRI
jgi:alanine dehydrogenase